MNNITRLPVTRRVTKCGAGRNDGWGCGIPVTPEWLQDGLCGECKRWRDQMDATEAFVRSTNPDGPDAA